MAQSKEERQAEKARRAALRAWAVQMLTLVAFADGKRERYVALADQCPMIEALLREQAAA